MKYGQAYREQDRGASDKNDVPQSLELCELERIGKKARKPLQRDHADLVLKKVKVSSQLRQTLFE